MKAFISSTVTDLAEYREVVLEVLTNLGVDYVTLDGLLVRDTEPNELGSGVLRELKGSDLVVLIVGYRYGSIQQNSGVGWVEAEFQAARRLGKPILAFLADDQASFPAASVDEDRARIQRFRGEVLSNYLVTRFRSPTDLATKLAVALTHLIRRSDESAPRAQYGVREKTIRILHLLLSSPGDVADEREAASRAIFRFNQQEVEESGVFIKLLRWEDMAPQIGPGPQRVINEQIGNYDLFVGMMWNRFGTPTDVAASGTEEEFLAAVDSWRTTRHPWITFYFCDRPSNITNEQQLEQKSRVLRFRTEMNAMGVVRKYNSVDDFENTLFQDLLRIVPRLPKSEPTQLRVLRRE
jgi:Domain of unknown function (DUF4062)